MLIAVVADVHGDSVALRQAIEAAQLSGYDELVSVGDLVDYLHPAKETFNGCIQKVIRWDSDLSILTASATLIRGNQEEKAAAFLGATDIPDDIARILEAPQVVQRGGFTFAHGHQSPGQWVGEDRWVPLGADFPTNVLVHGHHHRNSVIKLGLDPAWSSATDVPLTSGHPVYLGKSDRYLVNIGATQGKNPSWGMLDTESMTYTPYFNHIRFGQPTE